MRGFVIFTHSWNMGYLTQYKAIKTDFNNVIQVNEVLSSNLFRMIKKRILIQRINSVQHNGHKIIGGFPTNKTLYCPRLFVNNTHTHPRRNIILIIRLGNSLCNFRTASYG